MARALTTLDVRKAAMALPEVAESRHFLYHVPLWRVRGRTFAGMGVEETTVVLCVSESSARSMAARFPHHAAAVRRKNAQRSFLGVEWELGGLSRPRLGVLVRQAWAEQAPASLARALARGPADRRDLPAPGAEGAAGRHSLPQLQS